MKDYKIILKVHYCYIKILLKKSLNIETKLKTLQEYFEGDYVNMIHSINSVICKLSQFNNENLVDCLKKERNN
jgi:hypothetical protein